MTGIGGVVKPVDCGGGGGGGGGASVWAAATAAPWSAMAPLGV